ncbi:DUF4112 domain-containing protein [Nitrosococcus wardiae]|uniref:DUF4112 domain-containing protein n=1 Tax=Nitrosococcus wardiae TaxID=1814290 RepID=A0A4P7C258_9GAMM|nr:DUF4112 domain-containing protein [Nitrosococcus wardiae]QBQ55747.1 DUF4112 domain-containing protein [Nitrosococcus wardiae]
MAIQRRSRPTGKTQWTSQDRDRLAKLAYWLDERFRIPGTNWRIGWDGLVGLIPGVGDGITTALSAYIVLEAQRLGIPTTMLLRMIWNVVVDGIVGTVPLVGDLFDIRWKANRKNMHLLNEHLAQFPAVHRPTIYQVERSPKGIKAQGDKEEYPVE